MQMAISSKWCYALVAAGSFLVIVSAIFLSQMSNIITNKISPELVLRNNSDSMKKWKNPPVQIISSFYFFNVLNPDQVAKGTSRPKLEEKGPYVFRQTRSKKVEDILDDENLIKYTENSRFDFDPELSAHHKLEDKINFINVPAIVAVFKKLKDVEDNLAATFIQKSWFNQFFLESHEKPKTELFENHSVKELLFDGYEISFAQYINSLLKKNNKPQVQTKFGLMMGKNDSNFGDFVIYSGKDNIKMIQEIKTWKGTNSTNAWRKNSKCNKVAGTDGSGFGPGISKKTLLTVFNPQACLSAKLSFQKSERVKDINTFKFILPGETFQSPAVRPENECRCLRDNPKDCKYTGILDLSMCQEAVQMYMSAPHFLYADPELRDMVEGLEPDPERHESALYVDPVTGKSLKGSMRGQIVIHVQPLNQAPVVELLKNVKEVYLPLMWFEVSFEISDKTAKNLKTRIFNRLGFIETILTMGLIIGSLLTLIGLGLKVWLLRSQKAS